MNNAAITAAFGIPSTAFVFMAEIWSNGSIGLRAGITYNNDLVVAGTEPQGFDTEEEARAALSALVDSIRAGNPNMPEAVTYEM